MRSTNQITLTSAEPAELIPAGLRVLGGIIQNLSDADVWVQIGAQEDPLTVNNGLRIPANTSIILETQASRYASIKALQTSGGNKKVAFSFRVNN